MIAKTLSKRHIGAERDFRWRGAEVSRLEGFCDAVFAFAVTLLVVSLEVPRTFSELLGVMRGFVAFALSFSMLFWVWFRHYRFFRRYGLVDTPTIVLSGALVFVVLFYVYPLKFLFTLLADQFFGVPIVTEGPQAVIRDAQLPLLMVIYGLGFAAVHVLFVLLSAHALRCAGALELSAAERRGTRVGMIRDGLNVGVAGASVLIALSWRDAAFWSGMTYFLLAPLHFAVGTWLGRAARRARAAAEQG